MKILIIILLLILTGCASSYKCGDSTKKLSNPGEVVFAIIQPESFIIYLGEAMICPEEFK